MLGGVNFITRWLDEAAASTGSNDRFSGWWWGIPPSEGIDQGSQTQFTRGPLKVEYG